MMKRMVRLLVLSAVLASALAISAFAADFTHCADALHELGLFQGTESGYELDRAPSRVEAGVMLVRLLGAEEDALAAEARARGISYGQLAASTTAQEQKEIVEAWAAKREARIKAERAARAEKAAAEAARPRKKKKKKKK